MMDTTKTTKHLKSGPCPLLWLPLTAVLLLTGCAALDKENHSRIILKHPETMDVKTCEVAIWQTKEAYSNVDKCVKKYEELGYEKWGQY